ncbi:MAG: GTP-binding protein [Pseudomonadota bacterium]
MSADAASSPIPVTIIGGYLGAGKTTLVNHLLRQADGLRIAVLVNDFGDLPIDADLIESQDDKIISIAGGCVCCSFGSDLITALWELRDMQPRPEHLLVEASGVALPGMIAESVSLVAEFRLDCIVVLADAETVHERSLQTYSADTIHRQLSCADLIVLNKCDLPSPSDVAETETWLKTVFPNAACLRTEGAKVPLDLLTDRHAANELADARHRAGKKDSAHHPAYASALLEFPRGVDPVTVARALAHADNGLLRSKGHVESFDGSICTVQTVGRRFEVRPSPRGVDNVGKVIVIAPEGLAAIGALSDAMGCRVVGG